MSAAQQNSQTVAITSVAELTGGAAELVRPGMHPREFVSLLMEHELFADAIRFLAYALPKREAVWWGWVCARRAAGESPAPAIGAALKAAEGWISQPTEEKRRAAMAAAQSAGFGTAAGCVALAAFFSGGSIAPPDAPVIPPGEYLTAKAVGGSVLMAAVAREPEKATERFKNFVAQGLDVTQRIKLWDKQQG